MALAQLTYPRVLEISSPVSRSVGSKLYHGISGVRSRVVLWRLLMTRETDASTWISLRSLFISRGFCTLLMLSARTLIDTLCARLDDHRSLSIGVSMGHISQEQSACEDAYTGLPYPFTFGCDHP